MKRLLMTTAMLCVFFSHKFVFAAEQSCFSLALEPVRICLSAGNASSSKLTSVTIYDLQNQRLLADFQTPVYKDVSKVENFEAKFKNLIQSSQNQARFLNNFMEGHSDLSSMHFAAFETPAKEIGFGKLTIGNHSYVYLDQLDKSQPLEDLAH
ncbi:MAG: hypothetical protein KBD78_16850 [Oligoflexales bacterium]|nr:hypothetical protein [Oligoflexales bacterium]